jgi:hypothetical protein
LSIFPAIFADFLPSLALLLKMVIFVLQSSLTLYLSDEGFIPVKKLFAKKIVWKVGDILNLANFIPSNFRKPIIFGYIFENTLFMVVFCYE